MDSYSMDDSKFIQHKLEETIREPTEYVRGRLVGIIVPLAATTVLILLAAAAVFASVIAPYHPQDVDVLNSLIPPSLSNEVGFPHLLGTDSLGRDVLSGILYGARISLVVGIVSVLGAGLVGTAVGLIAGFFKGWVDEVITRLVDVQQAFPFILLAIFIMYILGRGLLNVIVVLIVTSWPLYARVVRAETLRLQETEFIVAARVLGANHLRIMFRHILPNALTPLIVVATFAVPQMIIFEAGLSFLGVGMPPDVVSWGTMLAGGRDYLDLGWWITTIPGIAIMLTVLSINILGDWLRDRFDPRMRNL
jgi:peptide/nickel transport system permease protein